MENDNPAACDSDDFTAHGQESTIETDHYFFAVSEVGGRLGLKGDWTISTVAKLERVIDELSLMKMPVKSLEFHCGGLQHFDLSGAWLLYRTSEQLRTAGFKTSFTGFRAEHVQFIDDVLNIEKPRNTPEKPVPTLVQITRFLNHTFYAVMDEISMRYLWFLSISARLVDLLFLLGQLAHMMGDLDLSEGHFEDALEACRNAGHGPELAWSLCDYANMLLERNSDGDSEKAAGLLDESLAISTELGMRPLMERVLSRREILKA